MPTAINTSQTPGPVKAPSGRAGANITVHDRARGAFQDMLERKIEEKLEQIEQTTVAEDARPRVGRRARFAAERMNQAAGLEDTDRRKVATAVSGQLDGAANTARRGMATAVSGQLDGASHTVRRGMATAVSGQLDAAAHTARRGMATQVTGSLSVDVDRNLVGKRAPVQDHRFTAGADDLAAPRALRKRGMGAIKGLEEIAPMPSKDAEATSEFLKQARIAGLAGLHMTPAQVIEGMADEETAQQEVTLLWKDFMKRWLEGQKDQEEEKVKELAEETTDAEPMPRWDAYRAALSV